MKQKNADDDRLTKAAELIRGKEYTKARALLKTINHPKAREWLARLDEVAPVKKSSAGKIVAVVLVGAVVTCVGLAWFAPEKSPPPSPLPITWRGGDVAAAATNDVPAATASATITETASPTVAATFDVEAMAATGEAAINPIRQPLEQFADFQGVRGLSAIMLRNGVSVNIDANVAPADDVEETMWRVSALVQQHIDPVSQIRVNTYNNEQMNSLWLWEAGQWSVTRLATGITEDFSSPPAWMASPTASLDCPQNCDEAVALGWTAEEAGRCSNLDRDGDNVACYGD